MLITLMIALILMVGLTGLSFWISSKNTTKFDMPNPFRDRRKNRCKKDD